MISEQLKGRYQTVAVSTAKANDEDALRLINSIVEQGIDDDRPLVRIPEAEFVHAWLPLFVGEPANYNRQHYINRIGGAYREALVVNQAGEVLFTVPPINDREANSPIKMKSTTHEISNTLEQFEREKQVRPRAALDDLRTILMAHAEVMQARKEPSKFLDEWNAVFRRYGKPEVKLDQRSSGNSTQGAAPDDNQFNSFQDI